MDVRATLAGGVTLTDATSNAVRSSRRRRADDREQPRYLDGVDHVILFPNRRCAPVVCRTAGRLRRGNRHRPADHPPAWRRSGSRVRRAGRACYFAAAMESTLMVSPSSVPTTVTFLAANFSGVI